MIDNENIEKSKVKPMKNIPDKNISLFKSCLVSTEYPGVESSTKFIFDKLGIEYMIDQEQSCCTGLGHYSDIFDQYSTTLIAARNFDLAIKNNHSNIVLMCSTCYAINKKAAKLLNTNEELRNDINKIFKDSDVDREYIKDSIDSKNNIFHVVEILYNKKNEIKELINNSKNDNGINTNNNVNSNSNNDNTNNSTNTSSINANLNLNANNNFNEKLSNLKIATHHACHYCKVFYEDTIGGVRNPKILDELVEACGIETIGWFNEKRTTCGAGFRQRFVNKELSLKVTKDKLLSINKEDVDILVHMCPNCQMQFDRYQPYISKETKKELNIELRTIHLNIVQLIALILGADPYKVVGIQTHTVPIDIDNISNNSSNSSSNNSFNNNSINSNNFNSSNSRSNGSSNSSFNSSSNNSSNKSSNKISK